MTTKEKLLTLFEKIKASIFPGKKSRTSSLFPELPYGKLSTACGKKATKSMPRRTKATVLPPIRISFHSRAFRNIWNPPAHK